MGLDWDSVYGGGYWDDAIAAIETEPPWGPVHRAEKPDEWVWYVPGYDEILRLVELTNIANIQRGNQSQAERSAFPKFIKRPWDKAKQVKKIATTKMKTEEFWQWFQTRVNK